MTGVKKPYKFDFAISFSGEDRSVAEELANQLFERGAAVFYDKFYLGSLVGKRLDLKFEGTFGAETLFFVPIVSASYVERPWPQYEWNVAKREAEKRWKEFILPVRLDDSLLVGLLRYCMLLGSSVPPCERSGRPPYREAWGFDGCYGPPARRANVGGGFWSSHTRPPRTVRTSLRKYPRAMLDCAIGSPKI